VMPDVTGLTLTQAEAKLGAAGLKPSKTTSSAIPGTPAGIVIDQSPRRGQRVDPSTSLELQVSE
jgi:beta-lactam-binding protein with PASTA domain